MSINVNGREVETTVSGFLVNISDWSREVAEEIARSEDLALTDRHWDIIEYLRDEYINHGGNQPNTRNMVKAMQRKWNDRSVTAKALYSLFPGDPSKQAGRIGGLPESRRKGGY